MTRDGGSKAAPEITRAGRQARIVAILSTQPVSSQSELAGLLAAEGIDVTQATLSRDLEELGAVKLRGADGGVGVYVVPEDGSPVRGSLAAPGVFPGCLASCWCPPTPAPTWPCCALRPAGLTTWPAPSIARRYPTSSAPSPAMTPCS
ncbi:arginine repressor, DNA binding domain protein [Mycobacterium kansasii]|uniref:Arginine repressor n=1 Tax=Mycobacterium kansasii TaxID=1768 RepID=A0A1V3WHN3_MYCKA|nr:arginine repressor, DNA binding domain protein [Mycobacterium kansasii]